MACLRTPECLKLSAAEMEALGAARLDLGVSGLVSERVLALTRRMCRPLASLQCARPLPLTQPRTCPHSPDERQDGAPQRQCSERDLYALACGLI